MATRGLLIIKDNKGEVKAAQYNHYDSYLMGLGKSIIQFIYLFSNQDIEYSLSFIKLFDEIEAPQNPDIFEPYQSFKSFEALKIRDSFHLLEKLTNKITNKENEENNKEIIHSLNSISFMKQGLFCEYTYIINLQTNSLEIYHGGQDNSNVLISCLDLDLIRKNKKIVTPENFILNFSIPIYKMLEANDFSPLKKQTLFLNENNQFTFVTKH